MQNIEIGILSIISMMLILYVLGRITIIITDIVYMHTHRKVHYSMQYIIHKAVSTQYAVIEYYIMGIVGITMMGAVVGVLWLIGAAVSS